MRTDKTLIGSLSLALASLLLLPQVAFAANRVRAYDVRTILDSTGTRAMLVSEELAANVQLPAEIRLTVPKGIQVSWAGEILGGPPQNDPQAQYRVEPGTDYDTVVFTVTKARRAQVEFTLGAPAEGADGKRSEITWPAPEAADGAELAIQVPKGAQISKASPNSSASTYSDSVYYIKQFVGVSKGQKLELSVTYTGGALPAPKPQSGGIPGQQGGGNALPQIPSQLPTGSGTASPGIVIIALGAILFGTFFLLNKVKQIPTRTRTSTK